MGEVYRALDSDLGRVLALKVLPEVFASDPDRVAGGESLDNLRLVIGWSGVAGR